MYWLQPALKTASLLHRSRWPRPMMVLLLVPLLLLPCPPNPKCPRELAAQPQWQSLGFGRWNLALLLHCGWLEVGRRGVHLFALSLSLYIYAHYQNAVNCEGLLASAYGLGFRLLWVAGVSTRTLAQGRHTSFLKLYSNAYTLLQIP